MTFARPFMYLAWLAAISGALALTAPKAREPLSPTGPIHTLSQER